MKQFLGVVVVCILASARPAGAANKCTDKIADLPNIEVTTTKLIAVVLANPPTTRLRLSFDDTTNGFHHELEWDPAAQSPLLQRVTLEPGIWTVTPSLEPTLLQAGASAVMIQGSFAPVAEDRTGLALVGSYSSVSTYAVGTGSGSHGQPIGLTQELPLDKFPKPTLRILCDVPKPTFASLDFAQPTTAADQRAFGAIPAQAVEVLSLLAEIAIERAKAGALSLLKERLVDPLCSESGITLAKLQLPGAGPALPRTCELLQRLRLEDALSSGRPLLRALRDDLRWTIAPALIRRVGGSSPWTNVVEQALAIVNHAIDQGSFSSLQGQSALTLLADLAGSLSLAALDNFKSDPLVAQLKGYLETAVDSARFKDFAKCATAASVGACVIELLKNVTLGELQLLATYIIEPADRDAFAKLLSTWTPGTAASAFAPFLDRALAQKLLAFIPDCDKTKPAKDCAQLILDKVRTLGDLYDLAKHIAQTQRPQFEQLIVSWWHAKLTSNDDLRTAAAAACHGRLAVAVVKHCTKATCGADLIERLLTHPHEHFSPDTELPQSLCWIGGRYIELQHTELAAAREIVVQGLEVLSTVTTLKGVERATTLLRLLFKLGKRATGCGASAPPDVILRCAKIDDIESVLVALIQEEYVDALTSAARLVKAYVRLPAAFGKGTQLIGAIAAYARVYEETKDSDPKEAREARKRALESLIDSATDRRERGRQWVFSVGSNVSAGPGWTHKRDMNGDLTGFDYSWTPQVRVPLGFALDYLPKDKGLSIGTHLGVQFGDLGQFAAIGSDGAVDEVRWDNFISPGVEWGVLIGKANSALNISFHIEYAPALFAGGSAEMGDARAGALRFGFSAGYYVPFFDFN